MKKLFIIICLGLLVAASSFAQKPKGTPKTTGKNPTGKATPKKQDLKTNSTRTYPSRAVLIDALTNPVKYPNYIAISSYRARTANRRIPENSSPAIEQTILDGIADIVNVDIQLSSDSVPYLLQDKYLQRTTNFLSVYPGYASSHGYDYGLVSKYSSAEINKLYLRNPDMTYSSVYNPTKLITALNRIKLTNMLISLNIDDEATFKAAWDLVKAENAFGFVIFKSDLYGRYNFKTNYYDGLTDEQKSSLLFFPIFNASPPEGLTIVAYYGDWVPYSIPKGFQLDFHTNFHSDDSLILSVMDAVHKENKVKVHAFSPQPDSYLGTYNGNVPSHWCCSTTPDARGNIGFLLDPRSKGNINEGINGYIITSDPGVLSKALIALGKRVLPSAPARRNTNKR